MAYSIRVVEDGIYTEVWRDHTHGKQKVATITYNKPQRPHLFVHSQGYMYPGDMIGYTHALNRAHEILQELYNEATLFEGKRREEKKKVEAYWRPIPFRMNKYSR